MSEDIWASLADQFADKAYASVKGLAEASGDERFAWDSYRRLIQMFGRTVLDIDGEQFSKAWDDIKAEQGGTSDLDLDTDLAAAVVAVEWGEGVAERLAERHLLVRLERRRDDVRTAVVTRS